MKKAFEHVRTLERVRRQYTLILAAWAHVRSDFARNDTTMAEGKGRCSRQHEGSGDERVVHKNDTEGRTRGHVSACTRTTTERDYNLWTAGLRRRGTPAGEHCRKNHIPDTYLFCDLRVREPVVHFSKLLTGGLEPHTARVSFALCRSWEVSRSETPSLSANHGVNSLQ